VTNGIPLGCLSLLPVGTLNYVETLKAANADPDLTNVWGHAPIDSAIQHDRWNAVALLGSSSSSKSTTNDGGAGRAGGGGALRSSVLDRIPLASALQHNQWGAIGALVEARQARLEQVYVLSVDAPPSS
jgi:hypothetical protein